jgi:hypothetical protein
MAATITTAELAATIDTTPRTLRKFLRAEGNGVGKGSRYALPATKREVAALAKRFAAWHSAQEAAKAARNDAPAAADKAVTIDAELIDAELIDNDADLEPTDADLELIDNDEI